MADELQVRIISLDARKSIKPHVLSVFPQATHFQAIDMRSTSLSLLGKSGMVTRSALDTLSRGRKWHKEVSSRGAVGIHQSNRVALEYGQGPILLMEEDCSISPRIQTHVNELIRHQDKFDVAIFGAVLIHSDAPLVQVDCLPRGWKKCDDMQFILMHCVFYSEKGRKKIAQHLRKPQEVQIDALLSFLHSDKTIEVIFYDHHDLAWQDLHVSNIQETMGGCALCWVSPAVSKFIFVVTLAALVLGLVAATTRAIHIHKR